MHIVTDGPPAAMASAMRRTLQALDESVAPYDVQTMSRYLGGANGFFLFRVGAAIAGGFGLLGLLGVDRGLRRHGVLCNATNDRVRCADGDGRGSRGRFCRDVLFRGARLAALGTVFGLLVAAAVARLLRVVLLGVNPFDPFIYATLAFVLAAVCLLAAFVPAWRATAVDPVEALRGNA